MTVVQGVDASSFQGSLDWKKLRQPSAVAPDGFQFGIFRASVGTSSDTRFVDHVTECQGEGATPLAYHFLSVLEDPAAQLEVLAQQCGRVSLGTTRPALDVEQTPAKNKNESAADYSKRISAWFATHRSEILDNLRAAVARCADVFGQKPILYTYPSYWLSLGTDATNAEWTDLPLWVASPTRAPVPAKVPHPWQAATFHQWTDDTTVVVPVDGYPGTHALCDRFFGTAEELQELVRAPSS